MSMSRDQNAGQNPSIKTVQLSSVQNVLNSYLLSSRNLNVTTHRSIILPVITYGCEI
jgi:hypothetical protein